MTSDAFPEHQELCTRLLAKAATEPATPTNQVVYGYIHHTRRNTAYLAACADLLEWWCLSEGWHLGAVFRDRGVPGSTLIRPGFTGLMDVLQLNQNAYALVIETNHLFGTKSIATRLTSVNHRTGAKLRILTDELTEVIS
ncbi:MAG: hypothetical protein JWQ81_5945 [Amycolatopsis sp.]|jgi:hypothetical protein|nr:hypothetical protein [Amycolatopsis sp.]